MWYKIKKGSLIALVLLMSLPAARAQSLIPEAPGPLYLTVLSSSQIRLSWSDVGGESAYVIERSTNGTTFSKVGNDLPANTTTFTNTGLSPNTRYWYRIYAKNQYGSSYASKAMDATTLQAVPAAPDSVTILVLSSSQIRLVWRDQPNETAYVIERSVNGTTFSQVGNDLPANTTTFTNTGLVANSKYWYRVYAKNSAGNSAYSKVVEATTHQVVPAVPGKLEINVLSSSQIRLNWSDVESEMAYVVERSTNGTSFTKVGDDLPANTTTFTNSGLTADTKYWYRVYAKNTAGNSGYSEVLQATTLQVVPDAPTNLSLSVLSSSQIRLNWGDVATETAFVVERSTNGTSFTKVGNDLPANTTTFTDNGLNESTRYYYRVYAKNSAGNSGYSNVVNATTQATVPLAPADLKASVAGSTEINLTWADLGNETAYVLERSTNGTNFTKIGNDLPANTVTYSDNGLQPATKYYYRIYAKNAAGNSPYSNVAEATTQNAVPPAPAGLAVAVHSSSELRLTWTDIARETAYVVERSENGTTFQKVGNDLPANTVSFADKGLHPATRYYYRVYAKNEVGNSGYSNVANATTQAIDPVAARPGELRITVSSLNLQVLTWTANSVAEIGFEISRSTDGTTFTAIDSVNAGITTYSSENLRPATRYHYKVRAYFRGAVSDYSDIASDITDIINATEPERAISIYPNPSQDYVKIQNLAPSEILACSIEDLAGRTVWLVRGSADISLRSVLAGKYILRIRTAKKTYTVPLIKI